jgi:hypothetical protein
MCFCIQMIYIWYTFDIHLIHIGLWEGSELGKWEICSHELGI